MSKEGLKAVYVDADLFKAIKLFSILEDTSNKEFVAERVMDYLNDRYGDEFISRILSEENLINAFALITAKQMQLGTPAEETLLGALSK